MFDLVRDNPVATMIVVSEVGLWVLLAAGLVARYLLRLRGLGAALLWGIPLLDVALIVAAAIDLHQGAKPGTIHGIAALYLGVSVAFGPTIVRWADVRFAHRFAGGPAPVKPAKGSPEKAAALWREWNRVVLAAAIASLTLGLIILTIARGDQADALWWWIGRAWAIVGLWLVFGPLWEEVSARTTGSSSVAKK
ncbi:hypothetical protein [Nocardia brasiliensis]|uniref:hypothetical protein n=1 Tax=Nocardia brasiliensis TaxID=37326 RepID=UPI00056AB93B|nr:hypothetical protein [Nocardia brasiliensis]MBF6129325.1 hypothetical protein [Nocardia brasiliensis]MBF6541826.1 hypothetical protein [Nocardia brasiliensis]